MQKLAQFAYTFAYTFCKSPVKPVVSDYTPRHRSLIGKGGNCSPLFALGTVKKDFRGFTQQKIKENKKIQLPHKYHNKLFPDYYDKK